MTDTPTAELTRPIVGIENRTAQEVFDIMSDRIKRASLPSPPVSGEAVALYQLELENGEIEHLSGCFGNVSEIDGVRVVKSTPLYASPLTNEPVAEVDANDHTMGGGLVFKGSRMPVSIIVGWIRNRASNEEIVTAYPDMTNDQIDGVRGFLDATNEHVGVTISLGDAVYMEKYMRISGGSWIAFADRLSAAIGEPRRAALEGET